MQEGFWTLFGEVCEEDRMAYVAQEVEFSMEENAILQYIQTNRFIWEKQTHFAMFRSHFNFL